NPAAGGYSVRKSCGSRYVISFASIPACSLRLASSLPALVVHAATTVADKSTPKTPRVRAFFGLTWRFTSVFHFLITKFDELILFNEENLTDYKLDCLILVDYTVY